MSGFRLSPEAEAELDDIWLHIAKESGNPDIATREVENIADHFWLLARHPYLGRARDSDLRPAMRSLAVGNYLIIHRIADDGVVLILHIVHGNRDVEGLFGY